MLDSFWWLVLPPRDVGDRAVVINGPVDPQRYRWEVVE